MSNSITADMFVLAESFVLRKHLDLDIEEEEDTIQQPS